MTMPLPILRGISKANSKPDEADTGAPTSTRPRWNPAGEHPAPGPQEEAWLRSAYRQGINPYAFAEGDPIDPALERYYRESGNIPAGQVYVGPDGRYRRVNDAVREDPEINAIRMRAWDGVRFGELDRLNRSLGDKHPGEDQAVTKMAGAKAQVPTPQARSSDKLTMTRFGLMRLPTEAAGLGQAVIPVVNQDGEGGGIAGAVAAVGGQGRALAAPEPEPIAPFSPNGYSPNSIGAAANDNMPGLNGSSPSPDPAVSALPSGPNYRPAQGIGADPSSLDLPADARTRPNHDRTPQSAVAALMEDPYFGEWLSKQKKYWGEVEREYPEGVKDAKVEATQVLTHEAFATLMAYRHVWKGDERDAAFNAILPFATELVNRPYQPGEEYRYRSEAKLLKPNPNLDELISYVRTSLQAGADEKNGGRPGSLQTRSDIEHITTDSLTRLEHVGPQLLTNDLGMRSPNCNTKKDRIGAAAFQIFKSYSIPRREILVSKICFRSTATILIPMSMGE